MSVETVEPVGTEERSTSSSSNTEDLIPKKIRDLFENPQPDKFFQVYYLNTLSQIMLKHQWLFEGYDKTYTDVGYVEQGGTCTQVILTFQGRTSEHHNDSGSTHANMIEGERVTLKIHGEHIP